MEFQSEKTTYRIISKLGEGQFGEVYLVTDNGTNKKFAMKKIKLEKICDEKLFNSFSNEIKIMEKINNPRILKLYDKMKVKNSIYLITKFCNGGTLQDIIDKKFTNGLKEEDAIIYLRQIAEGFFAMHNSGYKIIHRDLKLANIFLDDNGVVIGDFGFAKLGESRAFTELGTPFYMAPETLLKNKNLDYNNKCDIWSIGVCFYKLIFGFLPFFKVNSKKELLNLINSKGINFNHKKKISPQCKSLLERLLNKNSKDRISFNELFNHPLIKINNKGLSTYSTTLTHKLSFEAKSFDDLNLIMRNNNQKTSNYTVQNHLTNSKQNKILNFTQINQKNLENKSFLTSNNSHLYNQSINTNNFSHFNPNLNSISKKDDHFLKYLSIYEYYKNVVIFFNDTSSSFKSALNIYNYKQVKGLSAIIFLVLKKKIFLTLKKIINVINENKNIFNLPNYEELIKTKVFGDLKLFFISYYENNKKEYLDFLRNITGIVSKANFDPSSLERYNLETTDLHILKTVKDLIKFYSGNKKNFDEKGQLEFLRLITLLFLCENIHSKLPSEQYKSQNDWKSLLVVLLSKKVGELENNLSSIFK